MAKDDEIEDFDEDFEFLEDDVFEDEALELSEIEQTSNLEDKPDKVLAPESNKANPVQVANKFIQDILADKKKMMIAGGTAVAIVVLGTGLLSSSNDEPQLIEQTSKTPTVAEKSTPQNTNPQPQIAEQSTTKDPANKSEINLNDLLAQDSNIESSNANKENTEKNLSSASDTTKDSESLGQPAKQDSLEQLIDFGTSSNESEQQKSLSSFTPDNTAFRPLSTLEQLTTANQQPIAKGDFVDNDTLNEAITNITQEVTTNFNEIKQLQTSIKELNRILNNLNSSIGTIDNKVLGLNETVANLSQDLASVQKLIKDEDLDITSGLNKNLNQIPSYNTSADYVVHAIIPGRAWLKSSSGKIITVSEGDTIGDYGKIAVIDAANSIVRTSSGISFR